ncbi:unnamed protein product [Parajaminaea phylloscopi]
MASSRFVEMAQMPMSVASSASMQHYAPHIQTHAPVRVQDAYPHHQQQQSHPPMQPPQHPNHHFLHVAQQQQQQQQPPHPHPHSYAGHAEQGGAQAPNYHYAPSLSPATQPPLLASSSSSVSPSSASLRPHSASLPQTLRPGSADTSDTPQWNRTVSEADWQGQEQGDDDDGLGEPALVGPDEDAAQKVKGIFACPHCDKSYKGKHARSIWRRHLQDKHGIPLSVQPRRTRWDADANRPKNAEERRERMLESKRRWARKKRALDKLEAKKTEEDPGAMSSPEEGATIAQARHSNVPTYASHGNESGAQGPWIAAADHSHPAGVRVQLPPQALFAGASSGSLGTAMGAAGWPRYAAPPVGSSSSARYNAASLQGVSDPNDVRSWPTAQASTLRQYPSSTLVGAFGSPVRGLSVTVGEAKDRRTSDGRTPFSPVSVNAPNGGPISTPSRIIPGDRMARSTSSGGSNPFSLEHHKISPQERTKPLPPIMSSSSTAATAQGRSGSSNGGDLDRDCNGAAKKPALSALETRTNGSDPVEADSADGSSSVRRVLPPLVGTPMRPSSVILREGAGDSMLLFRSGGSERGREVKSSVSRVSTKHSWRSGGVGASSDDEGDHHHQALSSTRKRGSERGDDLDSFNDSGICLPEFTPFHKAISRATLGSSTPASALLDGAAGMAFPRTIGRPTPLKRRRRGTGSNEGGDGDDAGGADQFSSPHHPNLAHSLGLAPQSALRSTGSGAYDFGVSSTPFHNSGSSHHSMLSMSLGFTPLEKGGLLSGSLGASPGSIAWPDSVRRPLAGSLSSSTAALGVIRSNGSSSVRKRARHSSDEAPYPGELDDVDDGQDTEDKENAGLSNPSGNGRYLPAIDETPSRPSGKLRRGLTSQRNGRNGAAGSSTGNADGIFDEEGDEGIALVPLRFNKGMTSPS